MEIILEILKWAIPSGGIGAAIAWVANRRLRTVEEKKKIEDTYKQMYDMVSEELIAVQRQNQENYDKIEELRNENDKTRRVLARLSRAIESIQTCPHRAACPVYLELPDEIGALGKRKPVKRQSASRKLPDSILAIDDNADEELAGGHPRGADDTGDTDTKSS